MSLLNNASVAAELDGNQEVTSKINLGQHDFLQLMVAPVQKQYSFQSLFNSEFLSQLTQFNANDEVTKMQESLKQLATSLQSNQALQASAFVGRKVLVENQHLDLGMEGCVTISIDSIADLSNVTASIHANSGTLVKIISLGQPPAGIFQFTWDGLDEDGQRLASARYTIEVRGVYEGKDVSLKTMTLLNVDSVTLGQNGEGLKLNVAGIGLISLDNVRKITV